MPLQFQRPQLANSIIDQSKIDMGIAASPAVFNFGGAHTTLQYKSPTTSAEVATKGYVDGLVNGLYWKDPVDLATIAALPACTYNNGSSGVGATLTANANGALTVDGVAVVGGDRILVKNQAGGSPDIGLQNGIYTVTNKGAAGAPFVLTRTVDLDQNSEFPASAVFVRGGSLGSEGYVCTNDAPPTLGTTVINFVQFTGVGDLIGGAGIDKTGDVISVDFTANAGLDFDGSGNSRKLVVRLTSNQGLAFTSGTPGIQVDYDNATIGIIGNKLAVKDNSISLAKLSMRPEYDKFTISGSGTGSLTLSNTIQAGFEKGAIVTRNGQVLQFDASPQDETEYSVSGNTVTFGANAVDGDVITVFYLK